MDSFPSWFTAPLLLCCLSTLAPSSTLLSQPLALSEQQQTWQQPVSVQRERSQRFLAVEERAVEESAADDTSVISATLPSLAVTSATLPHPALPYNAPDDDLCRVGPLTAVIGGALGGAVGGWILWFTAGGALSSDETTAHRDMRNAALIGAGIGSGLMLAAWAWQCKIPREPDYGPRWDPRGRRDEAIR